jgi:toxin YoeB
MIYAIHLTPEAKKDVIHLKRNEPESYKKLLMLVNELKEHPQTGTGKPKQLKGNRTGFFSRRITKRHRLVYEINNELKIILIHQSKDHYSDK